MQKNKKRKTPMRAKSLWLCFRALDVETRLLEQGSHARLTTTSRRSCLGSSHSLDLRQIDVCQAKRTRQVDDRFYRGQPVVHRLRSELLTERTGEQILPECKHGRE